MSKVTPIYGNNEPISFQELLPQSYVWELLGKLINSTTTYTGIDMENYLLFLGYTPRVTPRYNWKPSVTMHVYFVGWELDED